MHEVNKNLGAIPVRLTIAFFLNPENRPFDSWLKLPIHVMVLHGLEYHELVKLPLTLMQLLIWHVSQH